MKSAEEYGFSTIMEADERIKRRKIFDAHSIKEFATVEPKKRSKFFFGQVADHQEIWTVWDNNTLFEFETSIGKWAINCWPHKQFAEVYCPDRVISPRFVPIPINDFINEIINPYWDERELLVFPIGKDHKVECISPEFFVSNLLYQYLSFYGDVPSILKY